MISTALAISSFLAAATAQQIGTYEAEVHPALTVSQCTESGCTTSTQSVVVDANWRWLHEVGGYTNCYTGNAWDETICTNGVTCAANCALEGAEYATTYGVTTSSDSLTLDFVTVASQTNVGSRLYLMAARSTTEYQLLQLLGQELTFTVDVSNLPCGLNGALYLSEMDADGGMARFPTNKAGAQYGTGYCDAQCPQDVKFIDGIANSVNWTGDANDPNAGLGAYGTCCNEMDIWEANSISAAFTPHPCSVTEQTACQGTECGIGARYGSLCDADGCDFNSYRMGDLDFYGPGLTVDTTKPFEVVTQFHTTDGTTTGTLASINRYYVQNGVLIPNSQSTIPGVAGNDITDAFCTAQKTAFGDTNEFSVKGGLETMGASLGKGMVLVMSIWDDHTADMLWLDGPYPPTKNDTTPGMVRGTCNASSGVPATIEADSPGASVTFSNIKWGSINSTFTYTSVSGGSGSGSGTSSSSSSSSTSKTTSKTTSTSAAPKTPSTTLVTSTKTTSTSTFTSTSTKTSTSTAPSGTNTALAGEWAQCGGYPGIYTGPTACVSPYVCTYNNAYYSQCLAA